MAAETPGGWLADQYTNPANPLVHQRTTGPEIWAQTGGRITHLVAGVGTGGTITGTARHLREVAGGRVRIVAADPATSRYSGGDGSLYTVEAVGHYLHPDTVDDEWPETYDPTVVDEFVRVADGDAVRLVRRVAREEGLLLGGSAGTALVAALQVAADLGAGDVVVAIAPDSGRAYLSKYFDDDWCARLGFVDAATGPLVRDVLPPAAPGLAVVPLGRRVGEVAAALPPGPDLRPVVADRQTTSTDRASGDVVGSVSVSTLRHAPQAGRSPTTCWSRWPRSGSASPSPGRWPASPTTAGRCSSSTTAGSSARRRATTSPVSGDSRQGGYRHPRALSRPGPPAEALANTDASGARPTESAGPPNAARATFMSARP
ncbi:pyridoxal-phosphate dependent enzyme [Pseudonocardia benzenivorans]